MSPYDATPSPTSLAFMPSTPMMAAAPTIGADDLGAEVGRDLRPRELAGDGEPERDSRVDVVAADVPEGVDGGHDDRAERQGDHPEVGHRERRVAVDDQSGGHSPTPMNTRNAVPMASAPKPLEQGGLVEHAVPLPLRSPNDIRYCRT